jgi:hypothetical protein
MRSLTVSTDVYASIWAARQPGEDSEDSVLRRLLKVPPPPTKSTNGRSPSDKIGFRDPRFGIELPEGFEIFRTYRGTEYRAKATGGKWQLLSTGSSYPSLNQLSRAIGTSVENAWQNWYYTGTDGKRQLVTNLRK